MSILLVIFFFGFTIFIHELGHFLLARKNGMKVNIFSIGFGPRLWKIYTDSKGTEYRLSFIPLGGYVSIEGQSDIPKKDDVKVADLPKDHFYSKTPWQRIQVIVAGVVMNFLFAILLFVIAFLIGIPVIGNKVASVDSKLNETVYANSKQTIQKGDRIISVDNHKIDKWEDIVTLVATSSKSYVNIQLQRNDEIISLQKVPLKKILIDQKRNLKIKQLLVYPERKAIVLENDYEIPQGSVIEQAKLKGGIPQKNILGIYTLIRNNIGKKVEITYTHENQKFKKNLLIKEREVADSGYSLASKISPLEESIAKQVGLKNGDEIVAINKIPIKTWNDIVIFFENRKSKGKIVIQYLRNKKKIKTEAFLPEYSYQKEKQVIGIAPYQIKTENGSGYLVAAVSKEMQKLKPGIRSGDIIIRTTTVGKDKNVAQAVAILQRKSSIINIQYPIKNLVKKEGYLFNMKQQQDTLKYSLFASFKESFVMIYKKIVETISFLKQLIVGNLSLKALSGPIGIFKASYDIVEYNLIYFLFFFGQINVLLAFTNLLPIPVLDGGHLVITLYELITKKKLPHKVYYFLHLFGFVLMMTLTFYVIFNDIKYF